MGLRSGLLRPEWNCLYSLVSAGSRQSCRRSAQRNRADAPGPSHAGGASVAPPALSYHAAHPRHFLDRTSRAERCSRFPAPIGRRIRTASRRSRAGVSAVKELSSANPLAIKFTFAFPKLRQARVVVGLPRGYIREPSRVRRHRCPPEAPAAKRSFRETFVQPASYIETST